MVWITYGGLHISLISLHTWMVSFPLWCLDQRSLGVGVVFVFSSFLEKWMSEIVCINKLWSALIWFPPAGSAALTFSCENGQGTCADGTVHCSAAVSMETTQTGRQNSVWCLTGRVPSRDVSELSVFGWHGHFFWCQKSFIFLLLYFFYMCYFPTTGLLLRIFAVWTEWIIEKESKFALG